MIVKDHDDDIILRKLIALDKRLVANHPQKERVNKDLIRKRAEIRGEKAVDFPLQFLDSKTTQILHSIRLKDDKGFFQIDSMLITPQFILLLEVKNWYGKIVFHEKNQVTRIRDNEVEEGFPDPISQVKLQKHRLQNWLHQHEIPELVIHFKVVISFPSTIIVADRKSVIPQEVIHSSQLLTAINQLYIKNDKSAIPKEVKGKIVELLLGNHTPQDNDLLIKYKIDKQELIKGVFCEKCFTSPMVIRSGKWHCKKCDYISIDGHLNALEDYRLLIKDKVKNREAREFLVVSSDHVVMRLLIKARYSSVGENKNKTYLLDKRKTMNRG